MRNKMTYTIGNWKKKGLYETREMMEYIYYYMTILCHNCEKCKKEFKSPKDRCMDHCHSTGRFRNILCTSCNAKRRKINTNNSSECIGIAKKSNGWVFRAQIDGESKYIKGSIDKEWLIKFAENWKKENHYSD